MLERLSAALSSLMIPLLFAAGIYFGFTTRFFYILHPTKTAKQIFGKKKGDASSSKINPMRAASIALAGTLGIGNITGVITAIYSGGAGAVFWMWISAISAMSIKYAETVLAVKYRRGGEGNHYGGAPFYIKDGLGGGKFSSFIGCLFAIFCIVNSLTVGNIIQINASASAAYDTFGLNPLTVGVITAGVTLAVIIGGAQRISALTSRLIPAVSMIYIFMCISVIIAYRGFFLDVIDEIFRSAFSFSAAVGGVGGYTVAEAVRFGVTRGILTNEAGSGTSPTAHASSDAKTPHEQGLLGIFEVFADTIIICSLTAFAVLCAGMAGLTMSAYPMLTASLTFSSVLGCIAPPILVFVSVMFVLATIISQHYYGEVAISYLTDKKTVKMAYTVIFLLTTVCGSVMSPAVIWNAADITVGAMTSVNVICVFLMRRQVKEEFSSREIVARPHEIRKSTAFGEKSSCDGKKSVLKDRNI